MSRHGIIKLSTSSPPPRQPPLAWQLLESALSSTSLPTGFPVLYDASVIDENIKNRIIEAVQTLNLGPLLDPASSKGSDSNDTIIAATGHLIGSPYRILNDPELKSFILDLFCTIQISTHDRIKISKYDLFHCHAFLIHRGSIGLLFHAREYPSFHPETFPYNLGRGQEGSNTAFSSHDRNLLWLDGSIYVMDASEGSLIRNHLVWPEVAELGTIYEGDLGLPLFDLTLSLPSPSSSFSPPSQFDICPAITEQRQDWRGDKEKVDVMVSGWPLLSSISSNG